MGRELRSAYYGGVTYTERGWSNARWGNDTIIRAIHLQVTVTAHPAKAPTWDKNKTHWEDMYTFYRWRSP